MSKEQPRLGVKLLGLIDGAAEGGIAIAALTVIALSALWLFSK